MGLVAVLSTAKAVSYRAGGVPFDPESLPDFSTLPEFRAAMDPMRHLEWKEIVPQMEDHHVDLIHGELAKFEETFDREGYESFVKDVWDLLEGDDLHRYEAVTKIKHPVSTTPHCDAGGKVTPPEEGEFPGGAYGRAFGFNLVEFLTKLVMKPIEQAGAAMQGGGILTSMLGMMAMTQAVGLVSQVTATMIELVPPLIPPPAWLLMSLPCAPELLGFNCLGTVLYPITFTDFMMANVKDQGMIGSPSAYQWVPGEVRDEDRSDEPCPV